MNFENQRYITEKEVAQITSLSLATLRNDRFLGKGIPYIKLGKSVRYSLPDVIEYMESRKITFDKFNETLVRRKNC